MKKKEKILKATLKVAAIMGIGFVLAFLSGSERNSKFIAICVIIPAFFAYMFLSLILTGMNLKVIWKRKNDFPKGIELIWLLGHLLLWPFYAPYFAWREKEGFLDIQPVAGGDATRWRE